MVRAADARRSPWISEIRSRCEQVALLVDFENLVLGAIASLPGRTEPVCAAALIQHGHLIVSESATTDAVASTSAAAQVSSSSPTGSRRSAATSRYTARPIQAPPWRSRYPMQSPARAATSRGLSAG
jgi:hypothetical protein